MARPLLALLVAAGIVLLGVPGFTPQAFKAGWFERAEQTRRTRSQRRPTHGGLVMAVAIALGALVAGPSQPGVRLLLVAAVIAVVAHAPEEHGRGTRWRRAIGDLAVAVLFPLFDVRADLTGSTTRDGVLSALLVLALLSGIRSLQRSDGTVPALAAIGGLALALVGLRFDDPVAAVGAAVVGAGVAMVSHTWPPAAVRIGAIGPPVLAAALGVTAVGVDIDTSAARAALVPLLALAPFGVALVVREWDRRLRRRSIPPHLALPLAAAPAAVASERLAAGALDVPLAIVALVPLAVLAVIGAMTPRPEHAQRRGRTLAIAGAALVVAGGIAIVAGLALWSARGDMDRGRVLAVAGLRAARAGDLETAQAKFAAADVAFRRAADRLDGPAVRVGDLVPVAAQNLRSARVLADVGQDLSGTAVAVAQRAGADDLRLVDGRLPLTTSATVGAQLGTALDTLTTATDRLTGTHSGLLLPEVRDGSLAVERQIADAADSIEVAAQAARLLPDLLGAGTDRRWVVALLSPSERRGAGGFAGDYAELSAIDGAIDLVDVHPASEMNAATDPAEQRDLLPAVYAKEYGGWRPAQFWQNLSVTPDVPTFGEAVIAGYPKVDGFGRAVGGLITIDPTAVAALLELTGPITVPSWPVPITSENAEQILLFDQYDQLPADQIDTFQSDVIRALADELTSGSLPGPSVLASTLAPSVAGGHLHLWSPDQDEEALFEAIGADGSLGLPTAGDFVQLVTQNGGENKIDWYQRRTLAYEPTVDPATGAVSATATVTLHNTAPTSGVSSYIIGEEGGPTDPGEDRVTVTLMTPHELVRATDGAGRPIGVDIGREQGLTAISVTLVIPAGGQATIHFELEGRVEPTRGAYRLEVGHRAAVVPEDVQVHLFAAPGWKVTRPPSAQATHSDDGAWSFRGAFEGG